MIEVDVRDERAKLLELAGAVPGAARRAPVWSGTWRAALAAMPGPLLLWAFALPTAAAVWTGFVALALLIGFAVEQDTPLGRVGPGRVRIDEHGVTIEREIETERWTSAAIREVHALAEVVVIVSHRDGWLVIPRGSFGSPEAAAQFVALAQRLVEPLESWSWPQTHTHQWGLMVALFAIAAVLGWLAWDASLLRRSVCGPLAGVAVVLGLSESGPVARRLGRKAGRPAPPRPGTIDASGSATEAYVAAARREQLRPSFTLVLSLYVLIATVLYPTQLTGTFGTGLCLALVIPLLVFAIYEQIGVFELWRPWRPPQSWRQIEAGSAGIVRRHAGASVTVPWSKLRTPIVATGTVTLVCADGTTFETLANSEFAQPEERDAFIAIARDSTAV